MLLSAASHDGHAFSGTKRNQMAKPRDTLGSYCERPEWEMSNSLNTGGTSYNLMSEQEHRRPGITTSVALLSGGVAWSPSSLNEAAAGAWGGSWDAPDDRVGLPLTHDMGYGEVPDAISSSHHASPTATDNMRYTGPSHFYTSQLSEASVSPLCPESTRYHTDFYDPRYSSHSELMPQYTSDNPHLYYNDIAQDRDSQSKPIKWHQMPQQSDPKLEGKRLRAIKSHNDRERQKQLKKNLEVQFDSLTQEVLELRLQKKNTQDNIKSMKEKIERVQRGGEYFGVGTVMD